MRWRDCLRAGWLLTSLALGSCGDADGKPSSDFPQGAGDGDGDGNGGDVGGDGDNGDGDGDGDGDDAEPLPPEEEERLAFEAPQAGKTSVYVPNPITHRVAVVNADTFAIETLALGRAPTYAATVPGQDVAIVINVGSRDASLLRTVDGKTQAARLAVGHDANAIAVAPDGQHAVIYFDAGASNELAESFQDVTVVDLGEGVAPERAARGVSVGFRPRAVQFSADGTTAFVITEDGVSAIDLVAAVEGPTIARLVPVGDGVTGALSNDVQITPDGTYALARREGEHALRLIELASGAITELDLSVLVGVPESPEPPGPDAGTDDAGTDAAVGDGEGNADAGADAGQGGPVLPPGSLELTDVDLAPDGSFALAVLRNRGALVRIPIPAGFSDPSQIDVEIISGQMVGSVSIASSGSIAVAYTTAAPIEGVVLVDLTGSEPARGIRLRKSVRAVALSDDGSRALVLHTAIGSPEDADEEARIDASEGYSLIDTQSGFAKLQLTPSRIREHDIVLTPDAGRFFALLRDEHSLHMADLGSFQAASLTLAKRPSSVGLVPQVERLFVGQESEGGMITFVDTASGEVVKAVTGFELASRIRQ